MRARSYALLLLNLGLFASSAVHAAQRTFVASYGSDAAACTLASPCRSFSAAITMADSGGEVVVLDSAGYGPVSIAKSVTLTAPAGVHAAVTVPASGTGVAIGSGTYDVTLRGLTFVGAAGSSYGIYAQHNGTLTIERVAIEGAANSISIVPASAARVELRDVVLKRGGSGIYATRVTGSFTRVVADNFSGWAIYVSSDSTVAISQAVVTNATGNGYGAIAAAASGGGVTRVIVSDSTISNVFAGISANDFGGTVYVEATSNAIIGASGSGLSAQSPGATLIASRNSVTQSNAGLVAGIGGTLVTFNDNAVSRNTSDTSGTMTPASYR